MKPRSGFEKSPALIKASRRPILEPQPTMFQCKSNFRDPIVGDFLSIAFDPSISFRQSAEKKPGRSIRGWGKFLLNTMNGALIVYLRIRAVPRRAFRLRASFDPRISVYQESEYQSRTLRQRSWSIDYCQITLNRFSRKCRRFKWSHNN